MYDISKVDFMSEPSSDRLLVKKDNLARCAWCGTPESPKWVTTQKGEMFCSSECQLAKHSSRAIDGGFITACCGGIIMLIPIIAILRFPVPYGQPISSNQFGTAAIWIVSGLLFFITGVGGMIAGAEGKKYRNRKDKYRDVTLLQCEYCTQTNPPNVVRCQYCGASLTKAPFRYETTPPWIRNEMHLGRFRCPHCSSTYSYNVSKIENDGSIKCQNCGKPFAPPVPYAQWHESEVESSLYSNV
jgi:predicted Zn finger-like uncharacterized protein